MLRRVAAGSVGESLRLYTPDKALLFSSLDARRPGYAHAVALAKRAGFTPLVRLAGGQAALFLDASIAFAWANPDPDARLHIRPRFEAVSRWIETALRRLGLDARVGAVVGEYCPGEYSVNIGGRVKVMGCGQRVIQGAAHVGGVLTVGQTPLLRETLIQIYDALGIEFRPETAGGIADFDPNLSLGDLLTVLVEVLRDFGYDLELRPFESSIRREAEALMPFHASDPRRRRGALLGARRRDHKTRIED